MLLYLHVHEKTARCHNATVILLELKKVCRGNHLQRSEAQRRGKTKQTTVSGSSLSSQGHRVLHNQQRVLIATILVLFLCILPVLISNNSRSGNTAIQHCSDRKTVIP